MNWAIFEHIKLKKCKKKNEVADLYKKGINEATRTFGEIKFGEPKPQIDLEALKEHMKGPTTIEEALEEYKTQIIGWSKAYLKHATGEPNDESLLEDLQDDITTYCLPKLLRHRECEQISFKKYQDFKAWIAATLQSFRADLASIKPKELEIPKCDCKSADRLKALEDRIAALENKDMQKKWME